jgi:MYXO-CTERM domain-containing protein
MRSITILVCLALATSTAAAQVELKNDGFVAGAQVAFQSGFCTNEVAASRFLAPAAGRQLLKVRFLFGSTADTKTVAITVWDDTAGTTVPGMELYTGDYQVTGSANGIVEADLAAANITVPAQFRVGVVFKHSGLPSVARDDDTTIAADKNYILADASCNAGGPYTWFRSQPLGLTGDWVIRAEISAGGGGPGDAGVGDGGTDAPPGTGDPCTSNAQCPLGQHCDLALQICTLECRVNDDCGGGTCNSLGQCIAATGDGGGCGCRAKDDDALVGVWLVIGLALLTRRRRR